MRRSTRFAALLSAGILALSTAACGDDDGDPETTPTGGGDAPTSDIKVGMAYDVGGRGDQSFNDSAAAGLDQAVEEFGVESEESEAGDGEAETAREERLRTFADAGFNPILAVGFAYSASVGKVAAPQSLGGEDFGWFLERIPGAMMRLGTRTSGGATYDLHQGNLRVDERSVGIGARLLAETAVEALVHRH